MKTAIRTMFRWLCHHDRKAQHARNLVAVRAASSFNIIVGRYDRCFQGFLRNQVILERQIRADRELSKNYLTFADNSISSAGV